MADNIVFAGELNTLVEVFKNTITKGLTSENINTAVSLGKKFVKRVDFLGNEELDGRLISLSVAKYVMRYDPNMLKLGTQYFIRDQDGDYQINAVALFGSARNKFLEIKCSKRGE